MAAVRHLTPLLVLASIGTFAFSAASAGAGHARTESRGFGIQGSVALDSLDDGPHVYWVNRSRAIVLYVCNGVLAGTAHRVTDTLRFRGMCADSMQEWHLSPIPPRVESFEVGRVPRIFAVSDVHGDYDEFAALLRRMGVVDDQLRWTWGTGHLVILGDVVDRGDRVTDCLWLIYRLEREARKKGGRVHYVLGNHELMALRGDHRYLNPKYLNGIVAMSGITYRDLFGPDMELGRWLRTKHVAVRLNDIVFVHGGLGPAVLKSGLQLDQINDAVRRMADVRTYELYFSGLPHFLLESEGPLWYRGYHYGLEGRYEPITASGLDSVLAFVGAKIVVVGHSEIGGVQRLWDGRVYGLDVPVDSLGGFEGLLWERGTFFRVKVDGTWELLQ